MAQPGSHNNKEDWGSLQVDAEGFEAEMRTQRRRSKESAKTVDLEVGGVLAGLGSQLAATSFSGHSALHGQASVVALLRGGDSVNSVAQGELPWSRFHLHVVGGSAFEPFNRHFVLPAESGGSNKDANEKALMPGVG